MKSRSTGLGELPFKMLAPCCTVTLGPAHFVVRSPSPARWGSALAVSMPASAEAPPSSSTLDGFVNRVSKLRDAAGHEYLYPNMSYHAKNGC